MEGWLPDLELPFFGWFGLLDPRFIGIAFVLPGRLFFLRPWRHGHYRFRLSFAPPVVLLCVCWRSEEYTLLYGIAPPPPGPPRTGLFVSFLAWGRSL